MLEPPSTSTPCCARCRNGAHGGIQITGRQIGIFILAISSSCCANLAHFGGVGVALPFGMPSALQLTPTPAVSS